MKLFSARLFRLPSLLCLLSVGLLTVGLIGVGHSSQTWAQRPAELLPVQSGPILEPIRPNKPLKLKWRVLEGPRTEVFFYGDNEDLGELTLRFGEDIWRELNKSLEFIPNTKLQLQVYPNPLAWRRADWDPEQVRDRNVINTTAAVYYPGSHDQFYRQIKARAAQLLIQEILFSGASMVSLQNRVILHLPHWYNWGMANYLAEGWTPEDEARMRSLTPEERMEILQSEEVSPRARTIQKSIWHFVDFRFGRKKISEILYMTRITRSVNGGFLSVLGLSKQALTAAWREFCTDAYKDQRIVLLNRGTTRRLTLGRGNSIPLAFSASRTGRLVAAVSYKSGQYTLYIYDTRTGQFRSTGVRTKAPQARNLIEPPGASLCWSPDEAYLAAVMPKGEGQVVVYYSPKRSEAEVVDPSESLDWINSIDWSPNKKDLVVSACRGGQTDLYLTRKGRTSFKRLTNDPYDDLEPHFSEDEENTLYFTSNRHDSLADSYRRID